MLNKLFQISVLKNPNSIAVKTFNTEISYVQLDSASDNVAQQLIQLDVQNGELIAVIMDKGWEQIVAVLGILKSGAAYMPIEPNESIERINNLLKIGKVKIILTQNKYEKKNLWSKNKITIAINKDHINKINQNLNIINQNENDLAYVIFTSGSTGIPKGVMITHKAVINTIVDINNRFDIGNMDKILAISKLVFDLSVYDIFGMLITGGTIVIGDSFEISNLDKYEKLFFEKQISIWNSVPVLMEIFVDYLSSKYKLIKAHSLRVILLSGDWIPITLPQKIWNLFGSDVKVISLGGATEASIWSIFYDITSINADWKSIPYGKALNNQSFVILDKKLEAVRNNEIGELFIGGIGVATGYWHNKKLTQKHFIFHPRYGRLYRTGDLGRYLPDGNIEFLGRIDFQVKIAGYRVELNAIQTSLLKYPMIKQAVVTPIKDGINQKLIAYITPSENILKLNVTKNQIHDWHHIYDTLFYNIKSSKNYPLLNTVGWLDSYNNEKIPIPQMLEWANNTVKQILSFNPKHVLEIGCGSGILLFDIANKVVKYDATDFSKNAIFYVDNQLQKFGIKNVSLHNCEAIDTKSLSGKFDFIILNSVVQYFPNLNYLIEVINQCIDKILPNGYLFIGDIRSLQHLKIFYTSLLVKKGYDIHSSNELQHFIDYLISEDSELVIDHNFFYYLKTINPNITHVEVLLKEGIFHNEMNVFRYNVILYINHGQTPITDIPWNNWGSEINCLQDIAQKLEKPIEYLAVKNIPNQRLYGLQQLFSLEFNNTSLQKVCNEILLSGRCNSIDPETFNKMAAEHGYKILTTWSKTSINCFDLIIKKTGVNISFDDNYLPQSIKINDFSNTPFLSKTKQLTINNVRKFIRTQLPNYMVPHYFIIMNELPLTSNGKIDYKSLPKIRDVICNKSNDHIMPSTITEKQITIIWKQVLGVRNISITQSFFEVGGTSLLIIHLISELNKKFCINLELKKKLLNNITIQQIAIAIDKLKR